MRRREFPRFRENFCPGTVSAIKRFFWQARAVGNKDVAARLYSST